MYYLPKYIQLVLVLLFLVLVHYILILFLLLEMIRKKPIAPEKEGMVHFIGMVLLLVLMLVLTVSDVLRCFGG